MLLTLLWEIDEFTLSAPFGCDTIPVGLRTSEIASGKDVVSSHPHGQFPNRVGLRLEEVPRGDEYPTPVPKL